MGFSTKLWLAILMLNVVAREWPEPVVLIVATLAVGTDLYGWWRPSAPVRVTHVRSRGELVFRFRHATAAPRFARAHGSGDPVR